MQITSGTVTTVQNSPIITGSGVDWSLVNTSCIIIISGLTFNVVDVDTDTNELTLSADWPTTGSSGLSYVIVRDFSNNHSIPLLNAGDLEAAAIFTRAMVKIDTVLSTIGGASEGGASAEILVSKTGHGFLVGNVLTQDATGWVLAASGTASLQVPLCVVSEVVDADSFRIRFTGEITGITGVPSMTAGTTYYLRNTPTSGGGGFYNIVPSGDANIGTVQLPVLLATGTAAGIILTMPSVRSGTFGLNVDGMVPGYTSGDIGKVLKAGSGWSAGGVANGEVSAEHLNAAGSVNWSDFAAQVVGKSILQHMIDLHTRLEAVETAQSAGYLKHSNSTVIHTAHASVIDITTGYQFDWYFPDGITSAFVNHWYMTYESVGGYHTCRLWHHRLHLRKPSDAAYLRFLIRKPSYANPIGPATFILAGNYPMAAITHVNDVWNISNSPNTLWAASFAGSIGPATWETITTAGWSSTIVGDTYVNPNRGLHVASSYSEGKSSTTTGSPYRAFASCQLPAFMSTMQIATSGSYAFPGPCQSPYNFYNGVAEVQY